MHRVVNRSYSPLKPAAGRHGHCFLPSTFNNDHDRVLTQWTAIEYIGDDDEVGLEAFFSVFISGGSSGSWGRLRVLQASLSVLTSFWWI